MLSNSWFKKEMPLLGLTGMGGGAGSHLLGGGGVSYGDPTGHTASGGVISDWTDPEGTVYRTHVFKNTGAAGPHQEFVISALSSEYPATVEYLVVAGGGSAGNYRAGGGGAGGLRTSWPSPAPLSASSFPVSTSTYTATVGQGGVTQSSAGPPGGSYEGFNGEPSYFGPPSTPTGITANGGGYSKGAATGASNAGGSGGGADWEPYGTFGAGNNPPVSPSQGNPGGTGAPGGGGPTGGGGGAGVKGWDSQDPDNPKQGWGGTGVQVDMFGATAYVGGKGPGSPIANGWFAGGGGGGGDSGNGNGPGSQGGFGGGGHGGNVMPYAPAPVKGPVGPWAHPTMSGVEGTGGGGGGTSTTSGPPYNRSYGGKGGSGIVAVSYQIGQLKAAAKATGGMVSFYNNKTIHTFYDSGVFNVTSGPLSCEYVIVGGGGGGSAADAGGIRHGGGGGAGGLLTATGATAGPGPIAVTVGRGGHGGMSYNDNWPISPLTEIPNGQNGEDSSVAFPGGTITALGGGGGGFQTTPGNSGGSGGGSGYNVNSGGAGSPPQGNPGGAGYPGPGGQNVGGGGGGGAGAAGSQGTSSKGGVGGAGVQIPATFRNPMGCVGVAGPSGVGWVCGGGAGGKDAGGVSGGVGGGGSNDGQPTSNDSGNRCARAGTGSGGGCGSQDQVTGGYGANGFVLIAYPT